MSKGWCGVAAAALVFVGCGQDGGEPAGVALTEAPGALEEGVAPRSWSAQVAERIALGEYQLRERDGGALGFTNRSHDLRASLDGDGMRVVARSSGEPWELTVRTAAVGRASDVRAVQDGLPAMGDCSGAGLDERGECIRRAERTLGDGVTEWWTNDPSGLRQGWVVAAPPAGDGDLTIDVAFAGMEVFVQPDGRSADLIGDGVALGYDGLVAWDASGRELPAVMEAVPGGVRLQVTVEDASWPVTVDPLVSNPSWTAEGDQSGALHGISVAGAGDVNGDGFDDVIVGAPGFDNALPNEGRTLLYLGGPTGLAPTAAWTAESGHVNSNFGGSVSGAGDVNGDGYDDVIVGAPDFGNGQQQEGRAFTYLGSAIGLQAAPSWTAESNQATAYFGQSVAGAGDVNGDGYDDVIVGAHGFDNGQNGEGRAFVYLGSASGLQAAASWTAESNQPTAYFGRAVAGTGDVNGDGFDDVIVGARDFDNGQTDEGRAFVYLGSVSGLLGTPSWTAESNQESALFGHSVSGVGDINGDGYDDVVVGAYFFDNGQSNEGRAFAYLGSASGLQSTASWTAESDQARALFGFSVSGAGDVNGDGFDDVVVGAYQFDSGQSNEGRAFAYLGSASGLLATPFWTTESDQADANLGHSVSGAGDVNGDGFDDVIVGALYFANGQTNEGAAFVYLSQPPSTLTADAGGPYAGSEGQPVALDGSGSLAAVAWSWDCTDDGSFDVTGESAACTYPDDGVYTVRLQVEDAGGGTHEDTDTVTVGNLPPTVDAGPDASGTAGSPIGFSGSATDVPSDPLALTVDCGDGAGFQPVASASFTCTYATDGDYTVTLRADDGDGGVATDTASANVGSSGGPGFCDPSDWLCAAMPGLVDDANVAWGAPAIAPTAPVRLRPETLYAHLDALRDALVAQGCVVDDDVLGGTSGAWSRPASSLWGAWAGGAVAGTLGANGIFHADFAGGPSYGDVVGRFNSSAQFAADGSDGGFVAGRHERVVGNRGVWMGLHGTCDGSTPADDAVDAWYAGNLPSW